MADISVLVIQAPIDGFYEKWIFKVNFHINVNQGLNFFHPLESNYFYSTLFKTKNHEKVQQFNILQWTLTNDRNNKEYLNKFQSCMALSSHKRDLGDLLLCA